MALSPEEIEAKRAKDLAQKEKLEQQRADKLSSDMLKGREEARKDQNHLKNQLSENAKKQFKALKDIRPSSMIKAIGLASGSPLVAMFGEKLGDLSEKFGELKESRKGETDKLVDLLKKNGKSSAEIEKILADTKRMSGEDEDELFEHLASLGFKDQEFFDSFKEIKDAEDKRLISSNFDIVQQLKKQGVDEKKMAVELRKLLDENLKNPLAVNAQGVFISRTEEALNALGVTLVKQDNESKKEFIARQEKALKDLGVNVKEAQQLAANGNLENIHELVNAINAQEDAEFPEPPKITVIVPDNEPIEDHLQGQKDDDAFRIAERQSEATVDLANYARGISDNLKEMADEMSGGDFGLGTIAGLIAAPIFILVGFFQGLGSQLKWLDAFTKGGLTKIFAPLKNFFTALKELKIFKSLGGLFSGVGKLVMSVVNPIINFVQSFGKFASASAKFGSQFGLIAKFAQGFGKVLGKLFLPFQIIMGAFDFITGFIDGFKEDGIVGGIKGGITGLIEGLIGGLLRMLSGGLKWILGFFGLGSLGDAIDDGVNGLIDGFYGLINNIVDGISQYMGGFIDVIKGILTFDAGMIMDGIGSIHKGFINILFAPLDMFMGFLQDIFSFAGIDLPEFSISEFLTGKVDDAINAVKNFFGFGDSKEEIKEKKKRPYALYSETITEGNLDVTKGNKNQQVADELTLSSVGKTQQLSDEISRMEKAYKNMAPIDQSKTNNTAINTNNTNIIHAPMMDVGTPDRGFVGAVFGA